METKKSSLLSVIIVLVVYMGGGGVGVISPAIQAIADAFPSVPYSTITMVSTLPNLIIVPFSLLAGAIAGRRIKYKLLIVIAMLLYVVGGVFPFFVSGNFKLILLAMGVFGIGIGLCTPLGMALAYKLLDDKTRPNVLGWGSGVVQSGMSILGVIAAGALTMVSWRYPFLFYLVGLVPLLLVLFLMSEPEKTIEEKSQKIKTRPVVFVYSILQMLFMTLAFPVFINMSSIVIQSGLGDAAAAGRVLSLFNIAGVIAGLTFGTLSKVTKNFSIPFAFLVTALGMLLIIIGRNIGVLGVGTFIVGFGSVYVMPAMITAIGSHVTLAEMTPASGILMAFMNLGGFFTSLYIGLLMSLGLTAPTAPLIVSASILVLMAIAVSTYEIVKKPA